MILFLLYKTTEEYKKRNYYFDKFVLERYLYSFNINKICIVDSIRSFKKYYKHIIKSNNKIIIEKEALKEKFENKKTSI